GEKTRDIGEQQEPPPPSPEEGEQRTQPQDLRKERWWKLSPQQVMCMLWKNNLIIS
ncbi:hypothetical protein AB205_0030990, partial [Aquarana catesbeiana]